MKINQYLASFQFSASTLMKHDGESTITEKMAAVHFPSNALRSKIFKKANRCLWKDRRKAGGRFVSSAKISHN